MMTKDELYASDHPTVIAHPDWFSEDLLPIARGGDILRAEEPPKRGPGRPRKIETTEQNIEVTA